MSKVISKDSTTIAYDVSGSGPALILVDGAMCYRQFGPMGKLSELLSPHFTVYKFDRRGRGESSNGKPLTHEREIEDIDALIDAAGGSASLFGTSSGAALVLEAAASLGSKVNKIALYEPPYTSDDSMQPQWLEYRKNLSQALASGQPGEAAALFMRLVGMPEEQLGGMRQSPMWPIFEGVAPSLAADADVLGVDRKPPLERAARVHVPALVIDGGANLTLMPFMHDTALKLAKALPHARQITLEGQTHDVNLEVLAPVLVEWFLQ